MGHVVPAADELQPKLKRTRSLFHRTSSDRAFGSQNIERVRFVVLGAQQRLISGLATFAFTLAVLALSVKLNG